MDDIVERLRATPNWQRQDFKNWKDGCSVYDRAPFEAADEIERLRRRIAEYEKSLALTEAECRKLGTRMEEMERIRTAVQPPVGPCPHPDVAIVDGTCYCCGARLADNQPVKP